MTIDRKRISSGSNFEDQFAYSRAIIQGDWCFVSGTTGYDYESMSMPNGVADQAANAFATIERTMDEGGFSLQDIVRAQYTICLLYTSPSPRDRTRSRMPSSA